MTFEKALEAMKQGKSVIYKGNKSHYILSEFHDYIVEIDNDYHIGDVDVAFRSSWLLGDGWEIYEEPQKEPEMTAGHAIEVLETIRRACKLIPDVDEVIDFSVEVIDKQNQAETANNLNSDNESANVKHAHEKYDDVIRNLHILLDFYKDNDFYRPKIIDAIEALKRDAEPEKKCACHCKEKSIFTTDELVETASKIIDFMHWLTGDENDE